MCGIVEDMGSGMARGRHLVARFGLAIIAFAAVACSADSTLSSDGAEDPVTVVAPTETTATTASPEPPTTISLGPQAFAATDAAMASRIASAGLSGGFVRVVRGGQIVHERQIGSVSGSSVLSVASSTKWLTAATLMSLVDSGLVGLDDPVATWLPEFASTGP
ncbi:MAG: serine hydrolase, partial [Actinobacteria bacterium]|nr:serine hydrolase [Actinomycetota bacterium]